MRAWSSQALDWPARISNILKTFMNIRDASCSCGQLGLTAEGEPLRVSVCHCLACQKRTGSTYGFQARFAREQVKVTGSFKQYVRTGDEGRRLTFHFCPECGATVFYTVDDQPDLIAVPVGAFADPGFPAPWFSVYEARRHAWVSVPAEAEHLD